MKETFDRRAKGTIRCRIERSIQLCSEDEAHLRKGTVKKEKQEILWFFRHTKERSGRKLLDFSMKETFGRRATGTIRCRISRLYSAVWRGWSEFEKSNREKWKSHEFVQHKAKWTSKLSRDFQIFTRSRRLREEPRAPFDAELNALFTFGHIKKAVWKK